MSPKLPDSLNCALTPATIQSEKLFSCALLLCCTLVFCFFWIKWLTTTVCIQAVLFSNHHTLNLQWSRAALWASLHHNINPTKWYLCYGWLLYVYNPLPLLLLCSLSTREQCDTTVGNTLIITMSQWKGLHGAGSTLWICVFMVRCSSSPVILKFNFFSTFN